MDKILALIMDLVNSFLNKNSQSPHPAPIKPEEAPAKSEETTQPIQNNLKPITKDDLLKGRDKQYASEYTEEISQNLDKLIPLINKVQEEYGKQLTVNSGWRPAAVNSATPGAATHSKHLLGLAVDISDKDGELYKWVLQNLQLEKELDLYNEDFRWTPNWVHFQLGKPTSGHRIFVPSTAPASAPEKWDGHYSKEYDTV